MGGRGGAVGGGASFGKAAPMLSAYASMVSTSQQSADAAKAALVGKKMSKREYYDAVISRVAADMGLAKGTVDMMAKQGRVNAERPKKGR